MKQNVYVFLLFMYRIFKRMKKFIMIDLREV